MDIPSLAIVLGQSLGIFVLGATLQEVIKLLKQEQQRYPELELYYDASHACTKPIVLGLPENGLRLRFDGPTQRLRLMEVVDFRRAKLTHKGSELTRHHDEVLQSSNAGPTFHHLYQVLGPTGVWEYLPPTTEDVESKGTYVASWPGIAFAFCAPRPISGDEDAGSVLSSTGAPPAMSLAVFDGPDWASARTFMFALRSSEKPAKTMSRQSHRNNTELELAQILGQGRVELQRRNGSSFSLILSKTTPQDVIMGLGPPDAVYNKNDRRVSIYAGHHPQRRESAVSHGRSSSTDTQGSTRSTDIETDESDEELGDNPDGATVRNERELRSAECFFNYFSHGIDVFFSRPTEPSPAAPAWTEAALDDSDNLGASLAANNAAASPMDQCPAQPNRPSDPNALVATKLLIHGNIPFSYNFARHRRLRWTIEHGRAWWHGNQKHDTPLTSEDHWPQIAARLHDNWHHEGRGMVLRREWDDSPGSSCELVGLADAAADGGSPSPRPHGPDATGGADSQARRVGKSELLGFPGLIFEVLDTGVVDCVTVF